MSAPFALDDREPWEFVPEGRRGRSEMEIVIKGALDRDRPPSFWYLYCCPNITVLHYNGCNAETLFFLGCVNLLNFLSVGSLLASSLVLAMGAFDATFLHLFGVGFYVMQFVYLLLWQPKIDPEYLRNQDKSFSLNPWCGRGMLDRNRNPACCWRFLCVSEIQYMGRSFFFWAQLLLSATLFYCMWTLIYPHVPFFLTTIIEIYY